MTDNLYAVSDGLFALRRRLDDFQHAPTVLSPEDAKEFAAALKRLGVLSLKNEHEISRHRWNGRARSDREMATDVIVEATRPGTNLRLLARASHPFSDGHPRPGGAQ